MPRKPQEDLAKADAPELPLGVKLVRTLEGHTNVVTSFAFDPQSRTLVSGSFDMTVRLWEPQSGKLLRTLERHTGGVQAVAFSPDGALLASKSDEDGVCLWRCDTWELVAVLPKLTRSGGWLRALAFHPTEPLLATGGSAPNTPKYDRGKLIHFWELDLAMLLGRPVSRSVAYTSAKVVLVGESNVGKSYLAHRIATGRAPESSAIQRTHGMKFWPLEPETLSTVAAAPEGQRRDVVLWDMSGQDEYRLIHQLFLHDTTVALMLLDPTRGKTATDEIEAWNRQLHKHLSGRDPAKFLVGAKLDQASGTLDRAAIERLLSECGFCGFLETSAITGRGVRELCEAVAAGIDWEGMAKTSRPELFQRIRDEIETRRQRGEVVLHVADLHRALSEEPPTEEERRSVEAEAVQLAMQGIIARSGFSTGEPVLVLQVEEIERYAGSLIIAARNNPRGAPALELQPLAHPRFALPGISEKDRLPRGQEGRCWNAPFSSCWSTASVFNTKGCSFSRAFFPWPPRRTSRCSLRRSRSITTSPGRSTTPTPRWWRGWSSRGNLARCGSRRAARSLSQRRAVCAACARWCGPVDSRTSMSILKRRRGEAPG
jgi:small GTP-binding protein